MPGRTLRLSLALFVALSLALAPTLAGATASAQAQPSAQKSEPKKAKKVWTNDDLESLRDRPGLSVAGEAPPASEAPPAEGEKRAKAGPAEAGALAAPPPKEKDPKSYQKRLAPLRAELARITSEIQKVREFRAEARADQGGLVLGKAPLPLTPENQIEQLERRHRSVQQQIDEIEDEARRNGIPPGLLR